MAESLLLLWGLAIAGYTRGMALHTVQAWRYRRYLPAARYPSAVRGWIFDETNRALAKALLVVWGVARLGLVAERSDEALTSPTVLHLDLLTLALYWGLLLLFTNWTWQVRRQRAHDPEWRGGTEAP